MARKKRESDQRVENRIGDPIPAPGIGSRITAAADTFQSRIDAASYCGISADTLRRWERDETVPSFDGLARLAHGAKVSLDWLATGASPMRPDERPAPERPQLDEGIGIEFSLVPQYNVEASAGAGRVVERESEVGKLAFRHDWIRQKGLSTKDLVVIRVVGDSMSPTIRDGSLALVDTREEHARVDGIYVVMVDGHLVAKRLQKDLAGGGLYIRSDNPAYREQYLTAEQAENISIIGRVIWAGGEV